MAEWVEVMGTSKKLPKLESLLTDCHVTQLKWLLSVHWPKAQRNEWSIESWIKHWLYSCPKKQDFVQLNVRPRVFRLCQGASDPHPPVELLMQQWSSRAPAVNDYPPLPEEQMCAFSCLTLSLFLDCCGPDAAVRRGEDTQADPAGRDGHSGRCADILSMLALS